jgi:hypothetical protein
MPSNYKEIREKNIEEYGKGSRHLSYFADIYSTRTHFIYELLMNTEDALSRRKTGSPEGYVCFGLSRDRLEVRHNGAPFVENERRKDVSGICGIGEGTKAGDYTQIGVFGIGFKSVYAYTFFPRIHSCDEHFEIRRFVEPFELNADDTPAVQEGETCIVLPFDSTETKPEWAFRDSLPIEQAVQEIGDALRNQGVRSLLFLHQLTEIKWTLPDGTSGHFLREIKDETPSSKLVTVTDGDNIEEWRVFRKMAVIKDGKDSHDITVEVAFRLDNGKIRRTQHTELVAYFPTEKKTSLGFLIQAPFKTTKARDNIKSDDSANQQIINIAAQLVADSIERMIDLNLLDVSGYLALPLQVPEDGFFQTIYDSVRKALRKKPLLPGHGGTFIKAKEAKLARGKELVELFSPGQLGLLFGKEKLFWLDVSITESGAMADFHTYLVGRKKQSSQVWEIESLSDGLQVDADTLAPKLTADFLGRQPLPWLVKFIQYAAQGASALKRTPFIRLVSGKQLSLPADAEMPRPAWFAPKDAAGLDLSVFPLVHFELAANEDVRKFLEKEGIREIDAGAIVEKSVLPKYQDTNTRFDESTYCVDLRQIREAYGKANDTAKAQLNTNLNKSAWLACVHASGNAQDKIVWKKPGASDLFEKTADHETWFDGLEDVNAYFLHSSVIEALNAAVASLVKITTALTTNLSTKEYTISLSNEYGNHKQGLKGFDPNATIVGIKSAWTKRNQDRSKVLWKALLTAPLKIISGETQSATNRQRLDNAQKKTEYTEVGELCRNQAWLLDKSGKWRKPSQLLLTDLPEGFESTSIAAKEVAEKLGMKQPEREQALEVVTEGDPKLKMLIEHYRSASDSEREKILKTIPREIPPEPAPSFKDGLKNLGRPQRGIIEHGDKERFPVSDPDRYQEKLNEQVGAGVEEHQSTPRKITFSPVKDQPSNAAARQSLYEQYHGCCQVTGTTFPKANKNPDGVVENYFEAYSLLSYANADYLNDAGNMLCVSADTMAKFKCASFTFLESIEDAIETFKANVELAESVSVKIQLAGEECSIKWSKRHFMRLIALYEKA